MQFTDVTSASGIVHTHSHDPNATFFKEYGWMTAGAVAEDFNGDGYVDLYVTQGGASANLLYMNQGDGTFIEEAALRNADLTGLHMGLAAGDFDADGDIDIVIASHEAPHPILINDGTGVFVVDSSTLTEPALQASSPSWSDIDNDGDLDLALGAWLGGNLGSGSIHIYINDGNGGLQPSQQIPKDWNFLSLFADLDGDRYPDLLAVSDFGHTEWFSNDGNGLFFPAGVSDVENGMGSVTGDLDNDGDLDWFITAIRDFDGAEFTWGTSGNRLLINGGNGAFLDSTTTAGVRDGFWGWGATMCDFDNDGDLDLYHVNGWLETQKDVAAEFNDKPARLFENTGGNTFSEVAATSGDAANTGQGRCVVVFDYDQDGDEDIFIANNSTMTFDGTNYTIHPGQPALLRNDLGNQNNWVDVHLAGGRDYHPHGVGSRVYLTEGGVTQMRELNASSNFNGHGPNRIAHFGLGSASSITEIKAVWPTGDSVAIPSPVINQSVSIPSPVATVSARKIGPGETVHAVVSASDLPAGAVAVWTIDGQTMPNPALATLLEEGEYEFRVDVYSDEQQTAIVWSEYVLVTVESSGGDSRSIARLWNEQVLSAIRIDFPNPTVHARNLFHTSVAMWDVWAAFDNLAVGYLHNESAVAGDIESARREAISYAAYRLLRNRYQNSVNGSTTVASINILMNQLGFDPNVTTTQGSSPAALGNRVAETVLNFTANDGWDDESGFLGGGYTPVNETLNVGASGTAMIDPNRWQPLLFEEALTQNGQPTDVVQSFLGSHWGGVRPFALFPEVGSQVYFDPGNPPQLGGVADAEFKAGNVDIIYFSSLLDPDDGVTIDISPGAIGNNPLGQTNGTGYPLNPSTGQPYAPNVVKRGDFGRVLAEFWADGPESETPPGHWNVLANEVAAHPAFVRKIGGEGPELSPLEWDVKMYFAVNGSLHDAAIAAWGVKRVYDYVRPICSIRYMGGLGQSSDSGGASYHQNGLPLVVDLIEVITVQSSAVGERHEHLSASVGKIAIKAWTADTDNPVNGYAGVNWILAENWLPYQRSTFVTPAFAGYISGHSTFSRAAAEVLVRLTGSEFFPGGIGTFIAEGTHYLHFEEGPSSDVELQWATYYDAADQAGISRLYGGIHVPVDDGPGRIVGSKCGIAAWELASKYFDGQILDEPLNATVNGRSSFERQLRWTAQRGMFYRILSSDDMTSFVPFTTWDRAENVWENVPLSSESAPTMFYKVERTHLEGAP